MQTILWTLALLPGGSEVASRALPCVWNVAFLCFIGVTAIAAENPMLLLRPNAAIGIVHDHISHALNIVLLAFYANRISTRVKHGMERMCPSLMVLIVYRGLYDPSTVYGVEWEESFWWCGAIATVLLADRIYMEALETNDNKRFITE